VRIGGFFGGKMMCMSEEANLLPCAEKMEFDTKKQAATAALAASWQRGGSLVPYKCQHCQLWHMATKSSKNTD
jgi:hypothetical protein